MEESEHSISIPQLVVQVIDLPDEGIDLEGSLPFSAFGLEDDELFSLEGDGVRYRLHVALAKQDVYVTGSLEADVRALCGRCAEWAPLHLAEPKVFHAYTGVGIEPVDLSEDIREDVVLMFPGSFLCKEDCRGICPRCGKNLNEGDCGCAAVPSGWEDEESPWASLPEIT